MGGGVLAVSLCHVRAMCMLALRAQGSYSGYLGYTHVVNNADISAIGLPCLPDAWMT